MPLPFPRTTFFSSTRCRFYTAFVTACSPSGALTSFPLGSWRARSSTSLRSRVYARRRAERGPSPAVCAGRFAGPFLCLGVRDGDRLVPKMWCDLAECSDPTCRRLLGEREAYLFSAFTDPAYRGQNLAPYLRQAFYATLRARGRDHIFSCTDYFNLAARRFKAKLGALDEALLLGVTLFVRYRRTLTLRRYRPREPV